MGRDLTECPDCGMAYQWHDAEKCFHIQKSKLKAENKKLRECLSDAHEAHKSFDPLATVRWLQKWKQCLKELGE